MKYYCEDCGEIFEAEDCNKVCEDPSPSGVGLPEGCYEYDTCPYCQSDSLMEAEQCICCGEYYSKTNMDDLCESCSIDIYKSVEAVIRELSEKYQKTFMDMKEIVINTLID